MNVNMLNGRKYVIRVIKLVGVPDALFLGATADGNPTKTCWSALDFRYYRFAGCNCLSHQYSATHSSQRAAATRCRYTRGRRPVITVASGSQDLLQHNPVPPYQNNSVY
jgi:hypothetical protein